MKRVIPPTIEFHYVDAPDSAKRLQLAYNRILEIARRNLVKKKRKETK